MREGIGTIKNTKIFKVLSTVVSKKLTLLRYPFKNKEYQQEEIVKTVKEVNFKGLSHKENMVQVILKVDS